MTFTEKILQHSNSYNFYKRGYKKLTKKNKELTKKNKELTKKNKELTKVKFDSEVLLYDVTSEQIKDNAILMDSFFNNPHLELNKTMWFVPFFDHIFKGGIYTIFRTANYMSETYGTHNTFVFNGSPRKSMEELSKEIKETFPNLKFDVIYMVLFGEEKDLPETDAGFCTYWTTAYNLVKYNNCRAKFYFNQDYEPLFQSAGSVYGLIEETYRFNFIGIANTIGVKNKYESYGNLVKHFTPAVDRNIYFPPKDDSKDFKKYITFYGRPNNSRNGFILGIEALKIVKEYFGDKVEIFSVGAEFDLEEYDLNGVINNLGLLGSLDEVADLYRKCDIGLVFMFTPHPSYQPFEYMACGCATVTNINESNLWLLKDKENAILTEPVISCVADNIIKLLNNDDMRNRIVENGLKTVEKVNWDDELEKIIEFIKNPLDEIEENYKTIEKS